MSVTCKAIPGSIGHVLWTYRQISGHTQAEAAHALGIDATYLSKIENGVLPPGRRTLNEAAKLYNVRVEILRGIAGRCEHCGGKWDNERTAVETIGIYEVHRSGDGYYRVWDTESNTYVPEDEGVAAYRFARLEAARTWCRRDLAGLGPGV